MDSERYLANPNDDTNKWVKSPYQDVAVVREIELHEMVFENIVQYGDLIAMTCAISGKTLTYSQLYKDSRAFGAGLIEAGFQKGEIAAISLPNCLEYPVAVLGCWSAGLTLVTCNPRHTVDETLTQMKLAQPRVVITESSLRGALVKSNADNPNLSTIILIDSDENEVAGIDCLSFRMMRERSNPDKVTFSSGKGTDTTETLAWLAFSSGTTGPPKLAQLSHALIATTFVQYTHEETTPTKGYLETGEQERLITFFPFFHVGGFVVTIVLGMCQGSHAMLLPRFEPTLFLRVIREHQPTCLHLVTPIISHIVTCNDYSATEMESVRSIVVAGAPIGKGLIRELLVKTNHQIFFTELYGMTELLFTHMLDRSSKYNKIGSCGRCLASTISRVVDLDTGKDLGPNQNGEIFTKSPVPIKGYFRNEEATKDFVDDANWARTGDVGYYDEDGYFYIVDRIKELIKVNAFQVAPSELEGLLKNHPKVADCVVVGIPSEKYGEVPRAYIVPVGDAVSEQEIHDYIHPLVASYKQLKGGVTFVDAIPKSSVGKNLRREVKESFMRKLES